MKRVTRSILVVFCCMSFMLHGNKDGVVHGETAQTHQMSQSKLGGESTVKDLSQTAASTESCGEPEENSFEEAMRVGTPLNLREKYILPIALLVIVLRFIPLDLIVAN